MMKHVKYFDFDMLNKHYNEAVELISDYIWLAIILLMVYTAYKLFEKYDI
jgi:hypothetical protein